MADTAGGELLAHLTAAVELIRDLECQADLLRDQDLLHGVRDKIGVLSNTVFYVAQVAPGRERKAGEETGQSGE